MTGGAGFVGATLVRRLVESGRAVRVLDAEAHPVRDKFKPDADQQPATSRAGGVEDERG